MVLSTDSFTRANNAGTMGSTDGSGLRDPLAWTNAAGSWGIIGNQGYPSAAAGGSPFQASATILLNSFNVDITVTVSWVSTPSQVQVMYRYTDENNFYELDVQNTSVQLIRFVAGVQTIVIGSAGLPTPVSGDIWRVVGNGTTHTIYRNGTQIATTTDSSSLVGTSMGFRRPNAGTQRERISALTIADPSVVLVGGQYIGGPLAVQMQGQV